MATREEMRTRWTDLAAAAEAQDEAGVDLEAPIEPNDRSRANVALRDARALRLRLSGLSYEEIAAQLGWASPSACRAGIDRELKRRLHDPADELRNIELMRLDRVQAAVWRVILDPSAPYDQVDKAAKTFLQISKRRSDLLGLDAPRKIDLRRQIMEMARSEGLDPDQAIKDAETVLAQFDIVE